MRSGSPSPSWTPADDGVLLSLMRRHPRPGRVPRGTLAALAVSLGRTHAAVRQRSAFLARCPHPERTRSPCGGGRLWTPGEDERIRAARTLGPEFVTTEAVLAASVRLGRSPAAVRARARRLAAGRPPAASQLPGPPVPPRPWTPVEDEALRTAVRHNLDAGRPPGGSLGKLAPGLGRSPASVRARARRTGLLDEPPAAGR